MDSTYGMYIYIYFSPSLYERERRENRVAFPECNSILVKVDSLVL